MRFVQILTLLLSYNCLLVYFSCLVFSVVIFLAYCSHSCISVAKQNFGLTLFACVFFPLPFQRCWELQWTFLYTFCIVGVFRGFGRSSTHGTVLAFLILFPS